MDIRVKEVITNIRKHDFDVLGSYKMDINEARKLIIGLNAMAGREEIIAEFDTNKGFQTRRNANEGTLRAKQESH